MIDLVLKRQPEELIKKLNFSEQKVIDIISTTNINDLRKQLNKNNLIIVEANEKINRFIFSNKKVNIIFNLENSKRKDMLYARNSGLNQVLCKLAKQNNIAIGFSFSNILKAEDKVTLFGRIMQNIKFCRKYKLKMIIASLAKDKYELRSSYDLIALFTCLGMTEVEAKKALNLNI